MAFLKRFLVRLSQFLLIGLPLQLLGILILLPVVAIWDIGHLPYFLRWFDSADPYVGRDTSVIERINNGGYLRENEGTYGIAQTILNKYIWLALRNPINYFEYKYLGFKAYKDYAVLYHSVQYQYNQEHSSREIGDHSDDASGIEIIEASDSNGHYYEYYVVWFINYPIIGPKLFRFRMGHKLSGTEPGDYVQHVLTINPFHPIKP